MFFSYAFIINASLTADGKPGMNIFGVLNNIHILIFKLWNIAEILIYINVSRVTGNPDVRSWLGLQPGALVGERGGVRVEIRPYENAASDLYLFCSNESITRVGIANSVSEYLARSVPASKRVLMEYTPITRVKAVKNDAEIKGMRRAHVLDGVALCVLFDWLEKEMANNDGNGVITEYVVAEKLVNIKKQLFDGEFLVESFETISASGPNAALIHYSPHVNTSDRPLKRSEVFLFDSGSQYPHGTTDVTRTVWLADPKTGPKPPARLRSAFTLVLRGHIQIARLVFPDRSSFSRLDALARNALWRYGVRCSFHTIT